MAVLGIVKTVAKVRGWSDLYEGPRTAVYRTVRDADRFDFAAKPE